MKTICKKEINSYLKSMTGYVFIAFMLLMVGIYFTAYHMTYGYPYFGYTLSSVSFVFLIVTPILSMRSLAEEQKTKTDQLLLTSPMTIRDIVVGKFLGMAGIFLIAVLIICLYPLIMQQYGTVPMATAYTAVLGFALLGCANIAIGLFLSSLTESPVIAAVTTFGVLFLCYLMESIISLLSETAITSMIILGILILFLVVYLYSVVKNVIASVIVGIVCEGALAAVYFLKPSWLEGAVQKILSVFDSSSHYVNLASGILDFSDVIYYLSITGVCLFLTAQAIKKRRWGSKSLRKGSYSFVSSAVAVAIAVMLNLIAAGLPAQYRYIDVSDLQLTDITDTTKEVMSTLEQDVKIYRIVQSGNEDSTVTKLLEKYADLSSHVKTEDVDPVLHPAFVTEYTDEELTENSLIVVGEERSKVVSYDDMYEYELDYQTYSYNTTGFDGEGQITSAISYVASEDLPVIYTLTGHEESSLTTEITEAIEKENIDMQELNLLTSETVPEDTACVMIFNPQLDISAEEAEKLITYMEAGGKAVIITSYTGGEMPNLQSVLNNYGIGTKDGVVLEGDGNYYISGNPLYLVPEIGTAAALGSMTTNNTFVLMPVAQAIEELENHRDTLTIKPLLSTSESAYIKTDVNGTMEKESGDETGSFTLGMAVTETVNDSETKLVYLTSAGLFDQQVNAMVSGSNVTLLANAITWMCDREQSVSIPSKSLSTSYLMVTASSARIWGIVTVGFLPIFLLLMGGNIWFKRRKR